MSGCKINQIMEFGDIFYFILLLFFAILGFFNESRKKKNIQQQSEGGFNPPYAEEEDEPWLGQIPLPKRTDLPPPAPKPLTQTSRRPEFRSSLDLVTDFEGASSLKGSIFVYDADESFAQDLSSGYLSMHQEKESDTGRSLHPVVAELTREGGEEALKRGLIYGEIMLRKY